MVSGIISKKEFTKKLQERLDEFTQFLNDYTSRQKNKGRSIDPLIIHDYKLIIGEITSKLRFLDMIRGETISIDYREWQKYWSGE
jgi:hypothetical protein